MLPTETEEECLPGKRGEEGEKANEVASSESKGDLGWQGILEDLGHSPDHFQTAWRMTGHKLFLIILILNQI